MWWVGEAAGKGEAGGERGGDDDDSSGRGRMEGVDSDELGKRQSEGARCDARADASFASATESTEVEMGGAGSDGVTLVAVFVGAVVELERAGDIKASESICKRMVGDGGVKCCAECGCQTCRSTCMPRGAAAESGCCGGRRMWSKYCAVLKQAARTIVRSWRCLTATE